MLMLIPYLFPGVRLLDALPSAARMPALETLLGRGRLAGCAAEGVEAAVCARLGIRRQQDWPVAPLTLAADGGHAGDACWFRADPVHLRVMRDRIVLADSRALDLTRPEADALAASIAGHFGEAFAPRALHASRWYVSRATPPRMQTTPLACAVGRDIEPLMPRGEDALRYRAIVNEIQMLLHEHPVNVDREQRGLPAVNAVWLWGGGTRPELPRAQACTLYTDTPDFAALAPACGIDVQSVPAGYDAFVKASEAIVVLDPLVAAGQYGDAHGWTQALTELERRWFVPVRDAGVRLRGPDLTLCDPLSGRSLTLRQSDAWKIWKRPRTLRESCDALAR